MSYPALSIRENKSDPEKVWVKVTIPGAHGAKDQHFRAESETEMIQKLSAAQENASNLIRKQKAVIDKLSALIADLMSKQGPLDLETVTTELVKRLKL